MTPVFIQAPGEVPCAVIRALTVPSPFGELAGSCGNFCEMNRKLSYTDQMSDPPAWMLQVPAGVPVCCGER